jgi:hypothetical protein
VVEGYQDRQVTTPLLCLSAKDMVEEIAAGLKRGANFCLIHMELRKNKYLQSNAEQPHQLHNSEICGQTLMHHLM